MGCFLWDRGLAQIVTTGEPLWILTFTDSLFLQVGFDLDSQWPERYTHQLK